MSLLDPILGAVTRQPGEQTPASPLVAILATLLAQTGGLQGLMGKFSQAGLGNVFSAWVNTGPNPPVSAQQIQEVLGSDQLSALAAKLGIDPAQASHMLAEHLPNIIDRLTPTGQIDRNANTEEHLSSLIPSLLQQFTQRPGAQA